jgi:hypothetical protein
MNSISSLFLWLDGTDLSTMTLSSIVLSTSQVFSWRDKSSNAYSFVPVRSNVYFPVWSTNSLRFTPSSFQMISQQKIPATSTSDTFILLLPESINGPRQPFFDNADFTASETDNRVNIQVYADGNEFFKACTTPNYTRGYGLYRGELYAATDVNQIPNYLQKYDSISDAFYYIPISSLTANHRALAIYNGQLIAVGSNRADIFNGSTMFSTNTLSSGTMCPIVYNKQLYTTTTGFLTTASNTNTRPQLYVYQDNSNFSLVSTIQPFTTGTGGVFMSTLNSIVYAGNLYFFNSDNQSNGSITRYQQTTYLPTSLSNTNYFGAGLYNGNLQIGRNDVRIWKFIDTGLYQITNGRLTSFTGNGGAFVSYKGNLLVLKQGSTSNNLDFTSGETAGIAGNTQYTQFTTSFFNQTGLYGGMIVHDGKLFFHQNQSNYVFEYGNGTTLDSPLSSSAVLLMIRKSPLNLELWMNGSPILSQCVNFTYNNQPLRFMYIGGAAGTLNSAFSDPGMDHLQGCIYSYAQYSSNLSTTDRERAEGFLMWQYGFANALPATHPFRNSPPT